MRTRLALLAAIAAAAVALTGCSGSSTPTPGPTTPSPTASDNGVSALAPADIITKSVTALGDAASIHLTGTVNGSTVDATVTGGNVSIKSSGPDGNLEARLIGTDLYYKGDTAFYKGVFPADQADALAAQRAGKWVKTSAAKDQDVASVVRLLRPENIVAALALAITPTKGAATTINGQPAIEIPFTSAAFNGSIFVATTGAPLPLQIKLAGSPGPINFDYGAQPAIEAPTPDFTV
jgi:hypothetical protein